MEGLINPPAPGVEPGRSRMIRGDHSHSTTRGASVLKSAVGRRTFLSVARLSSRLEQSFAAV